MSRKTLKIGSKPVKPSQGEMKIRYDLGKYASSPIGRTIEAPADTVAVWGFRGKDSDGPYWGLMCVTKQ